VVAASRLPKIGLYVTPTQRDEMNAAAGPNSRAILRAIITAEQAGLLDKLFPTGPFPNTLRSAVPDPPGPYVQANITIHPDDLAEFDDLVERYAGERPGKGRKSVRSHFARIVWEAVHAPERLAELTDQEHRVSAAYREIATAADPASVTAAGLARAYPFHGTDVRQWRAALQTSRQAMTAERNTSAERTQAAGASH
jgi:hypothetical protein